jgi:hypothetical protein
VHRVQQPAELGRLGHAGDVQGLLEVAVDAQVALVGAVDRRAGERLAQRVRGARGVVGVADTVELAHDLQPALARAGSALGGTVGRCGVKAPPDQVEHLGAGEHVR